MKIIVFKSTNFYSDMAYSILDFIYEFGMKYLPIFFLKKVQFDGESIYLPRWFTRKRMDKIDKDAQDLMNKLNWE